MNKYKVGDKFIVEIVGVCGEENKFPYRLKNNADTGVWIADDSFIEQMQPYTNDAEEAWETAKQIMFDEKFSIAELEEIFGTRNHFAIMRDHTPQEAKAKIEAWEKAKAEKEEIKVGDVIQSKRDPKIKRAVVTRVNGRFLDILYDDGIFWRVDKNLHKKTGEHIDIEAVLKQLKPIGDAVVKDRAEHFWEHRG